MMILFMILTVFSYRLLVNNMESFLIILKYYKSNRFFGEFQSFGEEIYSLFIHLLFIHLTIVCAVRVISSSPPWHTAKCLGICFTTIYCAEL